MADEFSPAEMAALVAIAGRAVRAAVIDGSKYRADTDGLADSLRRRRAAFVTLRRGSALRGCIGMMEATMPVADAVADRAAAAALHDPRFAPVGADELDGLTVEVSVLSPMEEFAPGSYRALTAQLRPGQDGLLVESDGHRATFLPQVWDELTDPAGFVAALWRKAGLAPGTWRPGVTRVWRYTAQHG